MSHNTGCTDSTEVVQVTTQTTTKTTTSLGRGEVSIQGATIYYLKCQVFYTKHEKCNITVKFGQYTGKKASIEIISEGIQMFTLSKTSKHTL